jgi:aldose 1-epimerase
VVARVPKTNVLAAGVTLLFLAMSDSASCASAIREPFGVLTSGETVEAINLSNGYVKVRLISYGASIQSVVVPDRDGKLADVALGYDELKDYERYRQYFGAIVGRFANRIAKGRFAIDGKAYQVPLNDGPNSLHGGTRGFDRVVWKIESLKSGSPASVTFSYRSADGDQGYPGALNTSARYSLNDANELTLELRATTDKPTIVNLSNHAFFNLAGQDSSGGVERQVLTLPAAQFTIVDSTLIPTGELRSVADTPFDFRHGKTIGRDLRDARDEQIRFGRGYDHNFVIGTAPSLEVKLMARVEDPVSGRVIELLSNQPGVQFYSGNFLDGTVVGKGGHAYRQGDAFALEPQLFPDTPNQPRFGSARLDPGESYLNKIVYRFSVAKH